jgi:DNA-binding NtrC family response regulator
MAAVLVVDDRSETRESLTGLLQQDGHQVQAAAGLLQALEHLRVVLPDVVLTHVRMAADDDGFRLLRAVKRELPRVAVILYSRVGTVSDAVKAMKLGAADYLEFPAEPDRLTHAIRTAATRPTTTLARHVTATATPASADIVAESPMTRALVQWAQRIGPSTLNVLLIGETGTGKEVFARLLHAASDRRTRPFVAVNCGAIPESLFEAELFGYRRGAFTNAHVDKPGLVEEAHGGSLLLDEIGDLPMTMQVSLLRFLEGGEVRRVGDTKIRHIDVRVIAATNRNLRADIDGGRFRADLYFRLAATKCVVPPLRERLDDLEPLIDFWLRRFASPLHPRVPRLTSDGLALLRAHSWPGNVRELRNVLEHAISLISGDVITHEEIATALGAGLWLSDFRPPAVRAVTSADVRGQLLTALERERWKLGRAARSLGIDRTTLWRRMKRYGITADEPY